MSLYAKLARKPTQFLTLTGMELIQFQTLLPDLERVNARLESERKRCVVRTKQPRQRQPGGGAQYGNDLPDRLLMLLLYYRLYVTQEFLTLLFQAANKSVICVGIRSVRATWEAVLPTPARVRRRILTAAREVHKQRHKRIGTVDEFREAYPELDFLIDGVEQPKRKPQDKQKRQDDYSGKKRRHTRKQLLTSTRSGLIVDLSPSVGGRPHDFQVFKDDHAQRGVLKEFADLRATFYGDSGFTGMEGLGLPVGVRLVQRARRNHPLTRDQVRLNRLRSSIRIEVEHTISRRKKYQIAAQEYRNRDQDYDQAMNIVAGLVNLRAVARIFQRTGVCI
jgi:DDE superfamily endonuclease